jgi:hypothetical protein
MIAVCEGNNNLHFIAWGVLQLLKIRGQIPDFLEQALILGLFVALEDTRSTDVKVECLKMYVQYLVKTKVGSN